MLSTVFSLSKCNTNPSVQPDDLGRRSPALSGVSLSMTWDSLQGDSDPQCLVRATHSGLCLGKAKGSEWPSFYGPRDTVTHGNWHLEWVL